MRILHVISGLDPRKGGVATALIGLSMAQAESGLDVSILTTFSQTEDLATTESLRARGVIVESIGPVTGKLGLCPGMRQKLKTLIDSADVVHIHALWEQVLHEAAVISREMRKHYIITPHGMLDPWSLRQSAWKKKLYMLWRLRRNLTHASAIHFTAPIERDLVAPLRLRLRTIVEPNGFDMDLFDHLPEPGSFRARYPIASNRPLMIFMGRLHAKKGFDLLIPAMAQMKNQDAVLAIVGPEGAPGYQATIQALVDEAGLTDRVFFTGMMLGAEKVAALVDSDLFVLTSYQENFGNAVVESLAAGTPVVITDRVNLHPDIIEGDVGGVTPADVGKISAELDRWLGNAELLRTIRPRARAFSMERYDWRKIAARWNFHYAAISGAEPV